MTDLEPKQLNTGQGSNRFKYQSFNKRVESIEISAARRIQRDFHLPEQNATYFSETLDKWYDLNSTKDFQYFYKKALEYGQTLPQILYHKDSIINLLIECLNKQNSLALQPLLEITTSLARDLQSEFFPYYIPILSAISQHSKSTLVENIEHAYNQMAFLFKYLQKHIVADLIPTFDVFAPLLGAQKQRNHIRRFAAESLSFLIRKLKKKPLASLINHIFATLDKSCSQFYNQGISLLFFEAIRGVGKNLYSQAHIIFETIVDELTLNFCEVEYFDLVSNILKMSLHQAGSASEAKPLVDILLDKLSNKANQIKKSSCTSDNLESQPDLTIEFIELHRIVYLTNLTKVAVLFRKGNRISDYSPVLVSFNLLTELAAILNSNLKSVNTETNQPINSEFKIFVKSVTDYFSSILLYVPYDLLVSIGRLSISKFSDLLAATQLQFLGFQLLLSLAKMNWSHFNSFGLPLLISLSNSCSDTKVCNSNTLSETNINSLVTWAHLFKFDLIKLNNARSSHVSNDGLIVLSINNSEQSNFTKLITNTLNPNNINWDSLTNNHASVESDKNLIVNTLSLCLCIIERISIDITTTLSLLINLANSFIDNFSLISIFGQIIGTLSTFLAKMTDPSSQTHLEQNLKNIVNLFESTTSFLFDCKIQKNINVNEMALKNPVLLDSLHSFIDIVFLLKNSAGNRKFSKKSKQMLNNINSLLTCDIINTKIIPALASNVSSFHSTIRLPSLVLIADFIKITSSTATDPALEILNVAILAERVEIDLSSYRDKINHVRKMFSLSHSNQLDQNIINIISNLAVSYLGLNLSVIWKDINKVLLGSLNSGTNLKIMQKQIWDSLSNVVKYYYSVEKERNSLEPFFNSDTISWINEELSFLDSLNIIHKPEMMDGVPVDCPYFLKFTKICDYYNTFELNIQPQTLNKKIFLHGIFSCELAGKALVQEAPAKLIQPRLDFSSIIVNVFNAMQNIPNMPSKNVAQIVDIFYQVMFYDWGVNLNSTQFEAASDLLDYSRKEKLKRLYSLLKLLAKLQNIKGYPNVQTICYNLLSNGDLQTQKLSLELLLYINQQKNNQSVTKYSADFRNLLSVDTFKDTLLGLNLQDRVLGEIDPDNSGKPSEMITILLRVLYGRLISKTGSKSDKTSMKSRRLVIFQSISALVPNELQYFCDLILSQFGDIKQYFESSKKGSDIQDALNATKIVNNKTKIGFLNLVTELIKQLGIKITPIFDDIILTSLFILGSTQQQIDENRTNIDVEIFEDLTENVSSNQATKFIKKFYKQVDSITKPKQNIVDDNNMDIDRDGDENESVFSDSDIDEVQSLQDDDDSNATSKTQTEKIQNLDENKANDLHDDNEVNTIVESDDNDISSESDSDDDENTSEKYEIKLKDKDSIVGPNALHDNDMNEESYLNMKAGKKSMAEVQDLSYKHNEALKIRQLSVKTLSILISAHPEHERYPLENYFEMIYTFSIKPRIEMLKVENTQSESSLVELIKACCRYPDTIKLLFNTHSEILPNLVKLLSAKKVHTNVTNTVLEILSNFIELEDLYTARVDDKSKLSELQEEVISCVKNMLYSNASLIISELQVYILSNYENIKSKFKTFAKIIYILSQISSYLSEKSPQDLINLLDLLVPFIQINHIKGKFVVNDKTQYEILTLLNKFIPMLFKTDGVQEPLIMKKYDQYFTVVSKLFGKTSIDNQTRILLCSLLQNLAEHDVHNDNSSLIFVSKVISDLNSFSVKRINEPNFDTRLATFNQLNERWVSDESLINDRAWTPLLYNLLFFAHDDQELSLRSNSVYGITKLIDFVKVKKSQNKENYNTLIENILWPEILKALKSANYTIKQEFVKILGHLVHNLSSDFNVFSDLSLLIVEDEEASFFFNITHIQMHRRIRALNRFNSILASGNSFNQNLLVHLFVPFYESLLFMQNTQSDHMMVSELILSLSEIAKNLIFNNYFAMVRRFLIKNKSGNDRVLTRLIVSLLNSFKFDFTSVTEESDKSSIKMLSVIDKSLLPQLKNYLNSTNDIFDNQKLADDGFSQRIPISLAYVKILTACPKYTMDLHLPPLLLTMCNLLKVRRQEVRDITRNTLSKILGLLGPKYFGYVVDSMVSTLNRGFMKHVLSYSLHFLLSSNDYHVGSLDYTMPKIVEVFIQDIFQSDRNDSKIQNNTYKETRLRNSKGFPSFELMARIVSLDNLSIIILPLVEILNISTEIKSTKSVKECLHQIAIGLVKNKTLKISNLKNNSIVGELEDKVVISDTNGMIELNGDQKDIPEMSSLDNTLIGDQDINPINSTLVLLKLVYSIISNHLNKELSISDNKEKAVGKNLSKKINLAANSNVIIEFGLQILLSMFKSGNLAALSKNINTEALGLLQSFSELIGNCLYSKHDNVLLLSLKIYGVLVKLKVKSMLSTSDIKVVIKRCLQILKNNPNTKSALTINVLQLLASILKIYNPSNADIDESGIKLLLNKSQLDYLISLIKTDFEVEEFQSAAFSLLLGIISKKLISAELYDLIDNVIQKLLIASYSKFVRKQCQNVLLKFYMDYPVSIKRLTNMINFILLNINNYELQIGRESGLEFLYSLINSLPPSILLDTYNHIFVSSVMTLINETELKLIEMMGETLKLLMSKMDDSTLNRSFELLIQWSHPEFAMITKGASDEKSKKLLLWKASMQILGFLVEAETDNSTENTSNIVSLLSTKIPDIVQVLCQTLIFSAFNWKNYESNEASALEDELGDEAGLELWQHSYLALKVLEKLLKNDIFINFNSINTNVQRIYGLQLATLWQLVVKHLTFPHTWNRKIASRLIGLYFSINNQKVEKNITKIISMDLETVSFIENIENIDKAVLKNALNILKVHKIQSEKQNPNLILFQHNKLIEIAYLSTVQLNSTNLDQALVTQIAKNLFFVSKLLIPYSKNEQLGLNGKEPESNISADNLNSNIENDNSKKPFDSSTISLEYGFLWIIRRMVRVANFEHIKFAKSTIRRKTVFQFMAACVSIMDKTCLLDYLGLVLKPIIRTQNQLNSVLKMNDDEISLQELLNQLLELLKQVTGHETFNTLYNKLVLESYDKKQSKKISDQQLKLENPQKYALIKYNKNEKKKRKQYQKNKEIQSKKIRHTVNIRVSKDI
ncbi:hypothetical protein BB561_000281 [Smittium simulii]|uniref:Uncharacterized protein n=1 Tax=Smittium simulii TaxID=133385 RepID=A0A2T9YZS3_9FUNG|nr:hypothetical protein BB561_000281 [Smittium simulii]